MIGMIAIHIAIMYEVVLGYPSVTKMFAVISSRVASPNMSKPTIAILASIRNYTELDRGFSMLGCENLQ